jgi:hypothetical protein
MRVGLPLAMILFPLAAGCATVPTSPLPVSIVTEPSRSLQLSGVRAELRDGRTIVRGRVARASMIPGSVWGHLHVEALAGGKVVGWADTRWTQLARRRLPRSSFWVRLPRGLPPIDTIRVSHVSKGHQGARQSGTNS